MCSMSWMDGSLTWSNLRRRHFICYQISQFRSELVLDDVDGFGLGGVPCHGTNANIGPSSRRTGLPGVVAPTYRVQQGIGDSFTCSNETDALADEIGHASNWGDFRRVLLRGDVLLVGTSAGEEK